MPNSSQTSPSNLASYFQDGGLYKMGQHIKCRKRFYNKEML